MTYTKDTDTKLRSKGLGDKRDKGDEGDKGEIGVCMKVTQDEVFASGLSVVLQPNFEATKSITPLTDWLQDVEPAPIWIPL